MNHDYMNTPPYYNQPIQRTQESQSNAFSIVSLVCGIASMVTCCGGAFLGVAGLVFGIFAAVKKPKDRRNAKLIVGMILSAIGFVAGIIWLCHSIDFYYELGRLDNC